MCVCVCVSVYVCVRVLCERACVCVRVQKMISPQALEIDTNWGDGMFMERLMIVGPGVYQPSVSVMYVCVTSAC